MSKPENKAPSAPASAPMPNGSTSSSKSKGPGPAPGGCLSHGCKAEGKRFSFCEEHYEHFKFGLIKKTGEPVSDYDKKFEHFMSHKTKRGSQKVA